MKFNELLIRKVIKGLIVGLFFISTVQAQPKEEPLFGTVSVNFQPYRVTGNLEGCTFVFTAIIKDTAYLKGDVVGVNGAIQVVKRESGVALHLKVGLKNISKGTGFERPHFAYLQFDKSNTANSKQASINGDDGYKLYVYSALEPDVFSVLNGMVSSGTVTLGFNRQKNGMDVLVPLDLTVADSQVVNDEKAIRMHSPVMLRDFSDCYVELLDSMIKKLDEKPTK